MSESILKRLADAVVQMDVDQAVAEAKSAIQSGLDPYAAIEKGLAAGMEEAGRLFEEEEYFIPELLLCSDAMYAGLDVLKPHLTRADASSRAKAVIGVIEGDTHDIGKNLVKIMLETSGFEVFDLGRDIPPQQFVDKAKEVGADLIAISTLMTTTMEGMAEVIRLLQHQGIRQQHKVMVGGGPISQSFADRIGADGYAPNAASAARLAKSLITQSLTV